MLIVNFYFILKRQVNQRLSYILFLHAESCESTNSVAVAALDRGTT